MTTLLTHGYFLEEDAVEQQIMKPYPPLGILYISAYLNQNNTDHLVYDTTFSTESDWKAYVLTNQPDLIAFYVNLMTKVKVIQLIQWVKQNPQLKRCKIVLGGPDITYNKENYIKVGADFLIIGEGEETTLALIQALKHQSDLAKISGLVYVNDNNIVTNSPRQKVRNIDELPMPNRSVFPIQKYLDTWKNAHGKSALNISTQRGCPYTCKWCSTAVYGQSYRRRSPELVVKELSQLMQTYKPDSFWFVDDVFTVSHKWIRGFAEAIEKSGLEIQYECITRAERMNDEVIQLLKQTGCIRVWIGAESGSQKIIDAMDRKVDVDLVRDQLIATRKAGIETGTFIMVGYPGETYDDILKTAKYLEEALPDQFTITKSYPIKGTALHDEVTPHITYQPKWETSTDREIEFKRRYSDRFYKNAIRYIYNRVQLKREKSIKSFTLKTQLKVWVSGAIIKVLSLK